MVRIVNGSGFRLAMLTARLKFWMKTDGAFDPVSESEIPLFANSRPALAEALQFFRSTEWSIGSFLVRLIFSKLGTFAGYSYCSSLSKGYLSWLVRVPKIFKDAEVWVIKEVKYSQLRIKGEFFGQPIPLR